MYDVINEAISKGFTHAVLLDDPELECEPRLRQYCNPEGCPDHGSNWVCPPGCGSLAECAEKIKGFKRGVLLQSVSELEPAFKDYKALNRRHNTRLKEFVETIRHEYSDVFVLTSGGCIFCESCAYPEPCLKPDIRMNSLSAYGIDVGKLCGKAKLEYSFRPDRLYYVALVLIN